jgi:hypothetical protein
VYALNLRIANDVPNRIVETVENIRKFRTLIAQEKLTTNEHKWTQVFTAEYAENAEKN